MSGVIPWRGKARLRPGELAEVASVSRKTIRRAIKSGELESFKQGGARFIPINAALEYLGETQGGDESGGIVQPSDDARDFLARIRGKP